jgi:hypothetical protein
MERLASGYALERVQEILLRVREVSIALQRQGQFKLGSGGCPAAPGSGTDWKLQPRGLRGHVQIEAAAYIPQLLVKLALRGLITVD